MNKLFPALVIALATSGSCAVPGDAMPCIDARNTREKNLCLGDEVAAIDKLLAAEYRRVIEKLRKEDAERPVIRLAGVFAKAQTAWIKFRDADCEYRSLGFDGASGTPAENALCLIEHARSRLSELQGIH